ncbi:MAG: hypothetical protein JWM76_3749 [Pseudonocardiales bacterium]|nr:hypothetical protein [Pseudonocardiales bacterium]
MYFRLSELGATRVRAKFLSIIATATLVFTATSAVSTSAHADVLPALESRPVWAGGTFHFIADGLHANTGYSFSATSGGQQTVQSNAAGTAAADLAIAGSVTATSTTVTVTPVGQSAVITQAFVVRAPAVLPEATSPWSAAALLAWFADGEIVDLTYSGGGSGPASVTIPGNASQIDPAGSGFPTDSVQFTLSNAPSTITVTAVGRTYHRSSTFTIPVTGTTLTPGQSRDAPAAVASSHFGYYFSVDSGPTVLRMANATSAPGAVWRGVALQPPTGFSAFTLGLSSGGNLVLTGTQTTAGTAADVVLWQSATEGTGTANHALMQDDGNLVIYAGSGQPVWSTLFGFAGASTIVAPATVSAFGSLASPDGRFRLAVQPDGNVVTYDSVGAPVWNSGTFQSPGAALVLQADGDLVVRSGQTVVWHTNTANSGAGNHLNLQNDGSLVLYNAKNLPLWSSAYGTTNFPTVIAPAALPAGYTMVSSAGRYHATLQTDGNLVVYNGAGTPAWSSGTFGYPGSTLILQSDGNMVIYSSDNAPVWNARTAQSSPANYLTIQDDGNLVLYTSAGRPVWNSLGYRV